MTVFMHSLSISVSVSFTSRPRSVLKSSCRRANLEERETIPPRGRTPAPPPDTGNVPA